MSLQLVTYSGSNWDDINLCPPQHIFRTRNFVRKQIERRRRNILPCIAVQSQSPKELLQLPINLDTRCNTAYLPQRIGEEEYNTMQRY